jgi:hypothetical protein
MNVAHNAAGRECFHHLAGASRAVRFQVNLAQNVAGR